MTVDPQKSNNSNKENSSNNNILVNGKNTSENGNNNKKDYTKSENFYEVLLQGKTLQVYWLLLEKGKMGIREIQKELSFSSPGVVSYQVQKLVQEGLVKQDSESDKYLIGKKVSPGVLNFFIKINKNLIPRFSLYLAIFLPGFFIFLLLSILLGDPFITHPASILLLSSLVISSLIFMFESNKMWKIRPIKSEPNNNLIRRLNKNLKRIADVFTNKN